MVTVSAPGKVYLFGEHAVVYGEPAIPCAVSRRAQVTVDSRDDDRLRVEAADLSLDGFAVEYGSEPQSDPAVDVPSDLLEAAIAYVDEAVTTAREAVEDPDAGFDVTIESDIPLGAGLGSSAAVVVAAIDAATRSMGVELDRDELATRAYQVERDVQGGRASRADTYCSTMGGVVRVEGDTCTEIGVPEIPIVIGYDGGAGDTGTLVSDVEALRETYPFAADTITTIGDVVQQGEEFLRDGDLEAVGRLMNFNHGLLSALGVSSRSLDAMVWAARDSGALGAKLTGAGGGGCIVAVDESDAAVTALDHLPACEDAFRAGLDRDGVRVE